MSLSLFFEAPQNLSLADDKPYTIRELGLELVNGWYVWVEKRILLEELQVLDDYVILVLFFTLCIIVFLALEEKSKKLKKKKSGKKKKKRGKEKKKKE